MTNKFWIKLYIEILDDPKMGRLDNHLWRRAVECFLLAGQGDDGALRPVEEMAWKLRLSEDKLLEDLHCLAEVGVVHEAAPGEWVVTNFRKRQAPVAVEDRVRRYREGNELVTNRYKKCNEAAVASSVSTSSSESDSFSDSGKGVEVQEKGETPKTPAEAAQDPDIQVFQKTTGGRIPGLYQYELVIDSVRLLRERKKLGDKELAEHLRPFWLAWRSRKRKDGREYDPANITWLTEWAVNGSIPETQTQKDPEQNNLEVIRQVARRAK